MGFHRAGIMIALVMLLSPITVYRVQQATGNSNSSTQVATEESTVVSVNTLLRTYYGLSTGITVGETSVSFPERIIGFVAPKGKCAFFSLPVNVTSGTSLIVEMTANFPVNLFILSDYPSGELIGCNVSATPIYMKANFTDFTLHWTAPINGIFYFVFTGPTAVVLLTNHGSMKQVAEAATITYPKSVGTELSTYSEIYTASSTTIITSPLDFRAAGQDWMLIIGAVILSMSVMLMLSAFARRLRLSTDY